MPLIKLVQRAASVFCPQAVTLSTTKTDYARVARLSRAAQRASTSGQSVDLHSVSSSQLLENGLSHLEDWLSSGKYSHPCQLSKSVLFQTG